MEGESLVLYYNSKYIIGLYSLWHLKTLLNLAFCGGFISSVIKKSQGPFNKYAPTQLSPANL